MSTVWERAGLKPLYDTGEFIIIAGQEVDSLPKNSKLFLTQEGKTAKTQLETKVSPDGRNFYEFYVLEPGTYQLQSPWGLTSFSVAPARSLNFQQEFGLFSAVVVFLVFLMAWRYLRPFKKQKGISHEAR